MTVDTSESGIVGRSETSRNGRTFLLSAMGIQVVPVFYANTATYFDVLRDVLGRLIAAEFRGK